MVRPVRPAYTKAGGVSGEHSEGRAATPSVKRLPPSRVLRALADEYDANAMTYGTDVARDLLVSELVEAVDVIAFHPGAGEMP